MKTMLQHEMTVCLVQKSAVVVVVVVVVIQMKTNEDL